MFSGEQGSPECPCWQGIQMFSKLKKQDYILIKCYAWFEKRILQGKEKPK
jgi:hypothetical protein